MIAEVQEPASESASSFERKVGAGWRAAIPERPFWVFYIASTLFALAFSAYFFLYAVYLVDLNLTEAQIGRVTAALTLGSMVGTLPAGILARRAGICRTLICCIPVSAFALALRVYLPGYTTQLILGFLAGLTLCAWAVCLAPSIAGLCSEKTRTFAFSATFGSGIAVTGFGTLLAAQAPRLLQAAMPQARLSTMNAHRAVAIAACAVGAISILPLKFVSLGRTMPAARKRHTIYPFLLRFLPAIALWTFASAAFTPFVTVFFTRHHGIAVQQLGMFLSSSQIAQAAGVLLSPVLMRRFGFGRSMMFAQVAAACAFALLAAAKAIIAVEVLYWMYIAFTCISEPCLYSIIMAGVSPDQRAVASAAHQLVSGFTVTLAAMITGSIIARWGYHAVFLVLTVCTIGSAAVFYRLGRATSGLFAAR